MRFTALFAGIAVCVYLVAEHVPSFDALSSQGQIVEWKYALFAMVLFLLHTLTVFYAWHYSFGLVGVQMKITNSCSIFLASLVTRYLPGGIWHLGSRLIMMAKMGVAPFLVSVTLLLEQASAFAFCLLVCVFFIVFAEMNNPGSVDMLSRSVGVPIVIILAIGLGVLFMLYPSVFRYILAFTLRLFKKKRIRLDLNSSKLMGLYCIHIISLLMFVGGYYFTIRVFSGDPNFPVAIFSGAVLAATLVGFVAPMIPGGIGVREATMVLLLSPFLAKSDLAAMAVLARILLILVEFMLFAIVVVSYRTEVND